MKTIIIGTKVKVECINGEMIEGIISKIYLVNHNNRYEYEILLSEKENIDGITPKYGCVNISQSFIKTLAIL